MIELYYWEDDPEAEQAIDKIKELGLDYEAIQLDAEMGGARPSVTYEGKTYWEFDDFLEALEASNDES